MFEDFSKTLQGFASKAFKKTGEVTELATLKTKVMSKKRNISEAYLKLGKAYYAAHKDELPEFSEQIKNINKLYEDVATLEEEMQKVRTKVPQAAIEQLPDDESVVAEGTVVAEAVVEETAEGVKASDDEEATESVVGEVVEEAVEKAAEAVGEATEVVSEAVEEVTEAVSEAVEEVTEAVEAKKEAE